MTRLEVRVREPRHDRGRRVLSAELSPPVEGGGDELWFAVPEAHAGELSLRGDPFALSGVYLAMTSGRDLFIDGAPVAPSLLRHLDELQRAWHRWFGYPVVGLAAADEQESSERAPSAVMAFSGGLDSAFSAYWNTRADVRSYDVRAGIMVEGADTPLADPGFERSARRARRMLESLDLAMIVISTNAWEVIGRNTNYAAPGIASILHLFAGGFGTGLIPSTAVYDGLFPHPFSPTTDWMLGSDAFDIVHDGAGFDRVEKLAALASWDEAIEELRVCIAHPHDLSRNCGRCNKCMLTAATFRVLGLEARCFDRLPSDREMLDWIPRMPSHPFYVYEGGALLAEAEARDADDAWSRTLRRRLRSKLRRLRVKEAARNAWPGAAQRVAAIHRRAASVLSK